MTGGLGVLAFAGGAFLMASGVALVVVGLLKLARYLQSRPLR